MATGFDEGIITVAQYQDPETSSFDAFQSESLGPLPTWAEAFDSLYTVSQLTDDWDGMGAVAPSPAAVANARAVLRNMKDKKIPAPTCVRGSPDGVICVEWSEPTGAFEVEISDRYFETIATFADRTRVTRYQLTP